MTYQPEGEVLYTWRSLMERTAPLEQPSPFNGRDHYAPAYALDVLRGVERLAWIGLPESNKLEQENADECARMLGRRPGFPLDRLSETSPPSFPAGAGSPAPAYHSSAGPLRRLLRSIFRIGNGR